MTDEELDAIEARVGATTPGRWKLGSDSGDGFIVHTAKYRAETVTAPYANQCYPFADSTFIACAKDDVRNLLAEVRRLQTENANLHAVLSGELVTAAERDSLRSILSRIEKSLSGDPEVES